FDGTVRFWDVAAAKEEARLTAPERLLNCISFSADGKYLAAAYNKQTGPDENPLGGDPAPGAVVWDVEAMKEILKVSQGLRGKALSVALSPDGKRLVTGGGVLNQYGAVQVWAVVTGKELTKLAAPRNWVEALAFSPDGKLLASTGGSQGKPS